jgi:site-specific recombinase XerD
MLLQKFIQSLETKDRKKATIDVIKYTLVHTEKTLGKPLEEATHEELQAYLNFIKQNGLKNDGRGKKDEDKNWTLAKSSLFMIENKLMQFYTFCFNETDDPVYHKTVKKLKSIRVDAPKNNISPKDILNPEEVKKLINVGTIERDRCLVASLYEGGLRLGELLALTNDMVSLDEAKQEVIFNIPDVEGCKTGDRSVLCLEIYGYVQDWMKCNTSNMFMPLSDSGVRRILVKLYEKAGIRKPCYPHILRHSSITNACVMKMQPNQISMRYWGIPNSNMLDIYLHLSEQIVNSGYRDAKGMGEGNGKTVINPLASRCVECGRLVPTGSLCKTCADSKKLKEENEKLRADVQGLQQQQQQQQQDIENTIKKLLQNGKWLDKKHWVSP